MLALALIVAALPAFLVDEGDPRCPAAALEDAIRARLPGVQLAGAPSGPDDLRGWLRPAEGGFALEVRRAGGEVALRRQLPLGEDDCKLAAETAALILDRFLDEIRWSGKPASIEPLPARPPPPMPAPLLEPPRFEFAAGPAVWLGAPNDVRAGGLIGATVRLKVPFEASFLALVAASSRTVLQPAGSIDVKQGSFALSAAACAEPGRFRLCAGPLAGARASLGNAAGVRQTASAMMWQAEIGMQARAALRLGASWLLGLQILGGAVPGSGTFTIAGTDAHRTLSKFDAIASISLVFQPF